MIIGIPRETKTLENRVSITPGAASTLVKAGHRVMVEEDAGIGSALSNDEYIAAGAEIVTVDEAWNAEMVIKVKEPLEHEYKYLREDLILFTYLHLAADEKLTRTLLESGTTAIAYETVTAFDRSLPLLTPMSEVAGRMATLAGAYHLGKPEGGRGVLVGGVPGVSPADITIIGGGIVGTNAAKMAVGLGARVTILDVNHSRLQYLDDIFQGRVRTLTSNEHNIRTAIADSDLVVGAVLIPGAKAPKLITREMLKSMRDGAVIVDVAIDQGGCVETIHATTHDDPTYVVDGIVHYGVANMPGAMPRTSTFALVNQTIGYALKLADKRLDALREDNGFVHGLNSLAGQLTCPAVGEAFNLESLSPSQALQA